MARWRRFSTLRVEARQRSERFIHEGLLQELRLAVTSGRPGAPGIPSEMEMAKQAEKQWKSS